MESLKNPVGNLAIPGRMRSAQSSKQNGFFKLVMATLIGVMVGYAIGGSFPSDIATWKAADRGWYFGRVNIHRRDLKNSLKEQEIEARNSSKIYVRTNPRGAELLPPGIIEARSDLFLRRLWGDPTEDLEFKQKYLLVLTVGYKQKEMVNSMLSRFSDNFSFLLFHYDGRASEWEELDWSQRAIHVSVRKQAKWWYAKRFLHPDIVAPYDYIFIWDEDLGVDHFNAEEYIRLVKKHGLEISQPALEDNDGLSWLMTKRRHDVEVHKTTEERPGWCSDPHLPPCAGFVEIMAPVFSRDSWRCVWHMIQNDLVHGWGLDLALQRCVRPAHEKIGVVDDQWLLHKVVPSLGDQGESKDGRQPWEGVRERCKYEWSEFKSRLQKADKDYFEELYQ